MGFGVESFYYLRFIQKELNVNFVGRLVDFGSQEYDTKSPNLNYLVSNISGNLKSIDPKNGAYKGPLRDLMLEAGFSDYRSYDIDGRFGSIPIDFNDRNPANWQDDADFVFNLGTSEHVFDQGSIFQLMHSTLKPGGFFYHVLPYSNYIDHGLFSYSPCFFTSLAYYNEYTMISMMVNSNKDKQCFYSTDQAKNLEGRANIMVLMRKNFDQDFVTPLQNNNPMEVLPQFERGNLLRDRSQSVERNIKYLQSFRWDPIKEKMGPLPSNKKVKRKIKEQAKKSFSLIGSFAKLMRK